MGQALPIRTAAGLRTGIVVLNSGARPVLCPFFGKCDGLLVVDQSDRSEKFYARNQASGQPLCDLILEVKPARLVCGFIAPADKATLRGAGIDVRLGSCTSSIEELVSCFCDLPEA